MKKEKETQITDTIELEEVDIVAVQEIATSSQELIPKMNVNIPAVEEEKKLISDEKLVGVYDEVLENIRQDRLEIDNLLTQFTEMVLNGGDATTSSKEALVNLIKIKLDTADKMSKIADLMTRARGVNTFPKYLAATQNNTMNFTDLPGKKNLTQEEKRALIESENRKQSKGIV